MVALPSISIVIPSFNQGSYIERTILSILKQDYEGEVEIIVSDGGSKDETVEVLKKYPQIKWWSEPDEGFVDAVTKGFSAAKGEILAIQSSDDFYLKDAFKVSIQPLIEQPDLSIIAGCDLYLQADRKTYSASKLDEHFISPYSLLRKRNISQHCCFFRKDVLEKVGGLRKEVDTCADVDFWYRALHFFKAKFIPVYTAVYQLHPAQRTQNLDNWTESFIKMIELCEYDPKYAERFKFEEEEKQYLYIQFELVCGYNTGSRKQDKEYALQKINLILQDPDYSDSIKKMVREFGINYGITESQKNSLFNKFTASLKDGTLAKKATNKMGRILGTMPQPASNLTQIDIDWWQKD
ncbi:MAG: glycosyltransferase [Thermosynechococcaceae cyanobacterium MS004]|nr:glycosyltransferase [Thermosynechococcaceae cyanobacterium MS004]